MTDEQLKMNVENSLLEAMNELDSAVFTINTRIGENYAKETDSLLNAKGIIKKVLNTSFDFCARNRSKKQQ